MSRLYVIVCNGCIDILSRPFNKGEQPVRIDKEMKWRKIAKDAHLCPTCLPVFESLYDQGIIKTRETLQGVSDE